MLMKETVISRSVRLIFSGSMAVGLTMLAHPSMAQEAAATTPSVQRVEITGSAIKRIDAETAVPITILKLDDLKKEGITTVEQIVGLLSSSQSTQGTSQSVGSATGGASFANLRGLGQNKTLVLLNGRRLANNAIDSSAPDLNMIPIAALERVEVLRDGASALYGTDAIGGVINFITKKDYTGGTISLGADKPQHPGAKSYNANVGFGFGDLSKDGYNVFGFLDYQKQDPLRASERPDINNRSRKTSGSTPIGNYDQGGRTQNPSFPDCGSPDGIPKKAASCGYLYSRQVDLVPTTERTTGFIKATKQLSEDHQLGLEYFVTQNDNSTKIAGVPYSALTVNPGTKYFPGMGITPLPTVFVLDPTQPINVRWRDTFSGGRAEKTENTQQRFIASLDGVVAGWDYRTAFAYNENKLTDKLTGGYTDGTIVTPNVLNGVINPFGPQDAAGAAVLNSAAARGTLFDAKGQVYSWDAQASREIGDWFHAGRAAAVAVGTEFRHEKFTDKANSDFASKVVASTGFDPAVDNEGSRNVAAVYTEVNVPVLKELDFTGSLRYDHYSDFGGTTNPKVSFRYQPAKQLLVRGSYSEGFRAPSLYDVNAPQTFTNTANNWNDPVRCPGGVPALGPGGVPFSSAANCDTQFMSLSGGNKHLNPETSKNYTLGFVFEPVANLTTSIDFWKITLKHQIAALSDTTIFSDPTKFAALFHRAPDGSLSIDGSQCPGVNCGFIEDTTSNLGGVNTNGIDLGATYRLRAGDLGNFTFGLNSTYVHKYEYQNQENGPFIQNVGVYSGTGPVFRWQSTLNANWNLGAWGVGVVNHYKSGYLDQNSDTTIAPNTVPSYMTWDMYGTWAAMKTLSVTFGVRNLADKQPPFSNQAATFQVGYDPRFADAVGRTYYLRGNYSF